MLDLVLRDVGGACAKLFGIRPTRYQEEFIRTVLAREGKGKYVLVASTRAGKTTATSMLAVLLAVSYPDEDVVVVAPTMRQSNILFSMVRGYFISNPLLYRLVDRRKGFTREIVHLVNGSTLRMLTAGSPEGLLGFGASALIIDETSSIDDSLVRTRLLRMLTSPRNREKPVLVLLGTPHRVGFLYDAWVSDDFTKFRWSWRDAVAAGIMDPEQVNYMRKLMSEAEFRRWFEAEFIPEEEGMFFNMVRVRDCVVRGSAPQQEPPAVREGFEVYGGLDVARYGEDETALVFVRVPRGFTADAGRVSVLSYWRWGRVSLSETIGRVQSIIESWRPSVVAVDAAGLGAGVFDVLAERLGSVVVPAFELAKREEVFMFVRRLVEERRLLLPDDEYFLKQFSSYKARYDSWGRPRISKTEGARDDLADALVMAVYCAYVYGAGGLDVMHPMF